MGWEELVQLYQAAKEKLRSNKKGQAIGLFRQALKNKPVYPKATKEEWNDYYSIKIQLGGILRDQGELKKEKGLLSECKQVIESRSILVEVIKELNGQEIDDKLQLQYKSQLQYSVFENYAKLLIIFAEDDIESQRYSRYRQQMNQSYKYFKLSQQIVIDNIKQQIASSGYISKKDWIERYLKLISNLMGIIMLEGQVFMDQQCFDHVLLVTDHVKMFYDLIKTHKIHSPLQTHLYRCYYNKSSVLLLRNRFKEALELFLQVYQFEKTNNLHEDAEKSRQQILRILISTNKIKEAYSYAISKDAKEIISKIKERRDTIKKAFTAPDTQIKKYSYEFLLALFNDFDEDSNQYYYDYQEMDRLISQKIYLFAQKKKERAELYYYLCEVNLKMRKYKRALETIQQALRIGSSQNFALRDWKADQIRAQIGLNLNDKAIDGKIKALRQQIKSEALKPENKPFYFELQEQMKNVSTIEVQLAKARRKAQDKVVYSIISSSDEEMIRKLEYMLNDKQRQKSKVSLSKYQISSESAPRDYQLFNQPARDEKHQLFNLNHLKQKNKLQVDNPEQQYKYQCKDFKVPERSQIISMFNQNLQFNPFSEILNMSRQQLEILLPLVQVANLDLRSHRINDVLLQIILNKTNITLIKLFKINGVNLVSHEMLLTIISKMPQVECLSFVDFLAEKPRQSSMSQNSNSFIQNIEHPRSIVHILGLLPITVSNFRCQQLKVLKLKYCGLMDQHLVQMGIERYQNLQELSLSHNLLMGKYFQRFMLLKNIAKINVSDNPLETFSFSMWKNRYLQQSFCLKALKLRSISLQPSLVEDLTKVLLRVVSVDLSSSKEVSALVDELMITNIREGRSVFNLETIVMKNIDLQPINAYNLMQMSKGLQQIDLRGCKFSYQTKRKILQQKQENVNLKMEEGGEQNGWLKGFALGHGGVDCQRL